VTVTIDRDRAAAIGVPAAEIGSTLGLLVGGASVARFDRDSNSYEIIPQVPQEYRMNPSRLGEFFIKSASGDMVPLSAVISVTENSSPSAIEQFNQLNSATISALPLPGVTTGDGLQTVIDTAEPLLPEGFFIDYSGQSRLEIEQGNTILFAFLLAVVGISLVLAAQFESFRDPLIILTTVPLSICGALIPMNMGLATVNIYTQVGLVTLIGLISKHGILMVEFANELQEREGLDRRSAIVKSAAIRLRPILMTTAAMVVGMVPLLMASGAGAKSRFDIGLVIAAGMTIGTIFTLFVLPVIYPFLARKRTKEDEAPAALPAPPAPQPAE
jgi:multidrug efflux pump